MDSLFLLEHLFLLETAEFHVVFCRILLLLVSLVLFINIMIIIILTQMKSIDSRYNKKMKNGNPIRIIAMCLPDSYNYTYNPNGTMI